MGEHVGDPQVQIDEYVVSRGGQPQDAGPFVRRVRRPFYPAALGHMGDMSAGHRHVDGQQLGQSADPHFAVLIEEGQYGGASARTFCRQGAGESAFDGSDGAELPGQFFVLTPYGHGTPECSILLLRATIKPVGCCRQTKRALQK